MWEELKDPITHNHYWHCLLNQTSQWEPPQWVDFMDEETGVIYYYHLESGESKLY